jgi:hypothetical protein
MPCGPVRERSGSRICQQEFKPTAALALGADLGAANKVTFHDNADELARLDYQKLTCCLSMVLAASRMAASGPIVMTDRVMI